MKNDNKSLVASVVTNIAVTILLNHLKVLWVLDSILVQLIIFGGSYIFYRFTIFKD